MSKVIVKGSVLIKDIDLRHANRLKKKLTYKNPKYEQAKKAGRFIGADTPKLIYYYKERGNSLIIPRGSLGIYLKTSGFPANAIIDHTVAPQIDINFTAKLRPYQNKGLTDILGRRYGVLEAATGAGKTIMGIAYACERGLKTLIIVHNKELLNQWLERFEEFTDIDPDKIGVIGGGKFKIGDVTVGIINSVKNRADEIKNEFGTLILDECHRCMGDTWVYTINTLRPKFQIGLSATPYRSDGLSKALFNLLGPILHKVDRAMLETTGAVQTPRIIKVPSRFWFKFNNNYSTMISNLVANEDRNIIIADTIISEFMKYNEPIMVVSDRISHCEVLRYLIDEVEGIEPVVLSGRLDKQYREQAVIDMKAGKYNVLIATVPLLGEGFDAPDLNSLFLTTPIKFQGRILQTIGRILRPSAGGQPRVYDIRDNVVPTLRYSGFHRDRLYKKQGWGV